MPWILRHNNERNGSYDKSRNDIAPFLYSKKCKKAEFHIIQIYDELKAFFKNMFLNPLLWCPDDIWERNKKEKTSLQKEASCSVKSRCVIESSTHYKFRFFFF